MTVRMEPPRSERGFSLIELLVSMAIGLVVTLAITVVMVNGERDKRSTTSVNDINQSGGYAAYVLDRQIRNAGAGFAQQWPAVGCSIKAQNSSGSILSSTTAFGDPFTKWPNPVRLAPVIIGADLANDVTSGRTGGDLLMVMAGTGAFIETPQSVLSVAAGTSGGGPGSANVKLANTYGFRKGDLVLLAQSSISAGCLVQQVGAFVSGSNGGADQNLALSTNLSPVGYGGPSDSSSPVVTDFGGSSYVAQIGNVDSNLPQFSVVGVGKDSTLYTNELLPAGTLASGLQPIADGVVEMRALYGTAPIGSTSPITWRNPSSVVSDPWYAGSISSKNLRSVVAIRLGLILRTSLYESKAVQRSNPSLFQDLGATFSKTRVVYDASKTDDAQSPDAHYRYRTVELTIPLPNVITAP